ncbi:MULTISPECIES: hypothetical protein [unclassified Streptomyces]|uniref:hypothetical protein n=1 Tax=unclassified Streptomyces TaxID=2593676 RepID=UPI0004AB0B38|nr:MULTISPECIES: hypothetical protein [unclassified Streptomyces]APU39414.1 hypothetical protein BSL84_06165 [Streptomyces sp. TN58]KJK50756.1 hypothetical protein UK14_12570 [Streptomyces sp. NRRL F-4428]
MSAYVAASLFISAWTPSSVVNRSRPTWSRIPWSAPHRSLTLSAYFFQESYTSFCAAALRHPVVGPVPVCPSSSFVSAVPMV